MYIHNKLCTLPPINLSLLILLLAQLEYLEGEMKIIFYTPSEAKTQSLQQSAQNGQYLITSN